MIGYPPLQEAASSRDADDVGISCGAHTDYGCWTILAQDDTPGALEVERLDGTWSTVDPLPGAFVINLGDMLSVWTGGRYAATPHRVRHTQRERYRTSVAYFFEPNFDAVITPLPGGGPGNSLAAASTAPLRRASQGGKLLYGEHLFAKLIGNLKPVDEE